MIDCSFTKCVLGCAASPPHRRSSCSHAESIGHESTLERAGHAETDEEEEDALRDEQGLDLVSMLLESRSIRNHEAVVLSAQLALTAESEDASDDDECEVRAASASHGSARAAKETFDASCEESEEHQDGKDEVEISVKPQKSRPLGVPLGGSSTDSNTAT